MTVVTVIEAIRSTLDEALAADERAFILGEDVEAGGVFRVTEGLLAKHPGQLLDTPLAESSIIGVAIGAAHYGMRPIAEIQFADFIHAGFDQLNSEASRWCYRTSGDSWLPMVVRAPWGGGVLRYNETNHTCSDGNTDITYTPGITYMPRYWDPNNTTPWSVTGKSSAVFSRDNILEVSALSETASVSLLAPIILMNAPGTPCPVQSATAMNLDLSFSRKK